MQKRFQVLKDVLPNASKAGLLISANEAGTPLLEKAARDTTRSIGLELEFYEVRAPEELEPLFLKMVDIKMDGLVVAGSGLLYQQREAIFKLATEKRLPTFSWSRETLVAGALISYGANLVEMVRRTAQYVDKLLKGAKPSDLPVEEPTAYTCGINLKTAKLIGVSLPQSIYAQATEVIE
jgi:putative ABC transport system substrate-binding protein